MSETAQDSGSGLSIVETTEETRVFELDEEPEIGETVRFHCQHGLTEKTVADVIHYDDGVWFNWESSGKGPRSKVEEYRVEGSVVFGITESGPKVEMEMNPPEGSVKAAELEVKA